MGSTSRDIKSVSETVPMATSFEFDLEGNSSKQSLQTKNLGFHLVESGDGRQSNGYNHAGSGTTRMVNLHGKPMSSDLSKTGGWFAAFFIFGKFPQFNSVLLFLYLLLLYVGSPGFVKPHSVCFITLGLYVCHLRSLVMSNHIINVLLCIAAARCIMYSLFHSIHSENLCEPMYPIGE